MKCRTSLVYLRCIPTLTLLVMVQFLRCFAKLHLASVLALAAPTVLASPASELPRAAQPLNTTITGRVVTTGGAPLAGVFITMQGATATATTNAAGNFLLASEQLNPVLTFKCAGYQTQTFLLKATGPVAIVLNEVGTVPAVQAAGIEVVNKPLVIADEQPTFPGGAPAYRHFLQQNVRYPDAARDNNIAGDVFISLVIDEMGRLLDAEVIKGVGYGLDEEALRLVRLMPWWTPARIAGKPARVPSTLCIRFGGIQPPPGASQR